MYSNPIVDPCAKVYSAKTEPKFTSSDTDPLVVALTPVAFALLCSWPFVSKLPSTATAPILKPSKANAEVAKPSWTKR
jgi:hypothetical protein